MKDLIKKILSEHVKTNKVLTEMANYLDWCKSFPKYKPEYSFCVSAEEYIKNELEDSPSEKGKRKGKKVFVDFEKGVEEFYLSNAGNEILSKKIIHINQNSEIYKNGKEELIDASKKLSNNCSNFDKVVEKKLNEFKNKVKLYFLENEKYSLDNRLPTNYSALAVLFTKFFEKKGAFDGVKLDKEKVNQYNWDQISKNWITHLFNTQKKFEDIRPDDEKVHTLSSLGFQELARIYFKDNDKVFNSEEIRTAVNDVLVGVRGKGFESEDLFENLYLDGKRTYIRYAKDYGFVDMFTGIDFIYEGANGMWIPVQVKTRATEPTYLISTLGCKAYVISEKKGKGFENQILPKKTNLPH
jgi:hypothetical protein